MKYLKVYMFVILFPCIGETTTHTYSVSPDTKTHSVDEFNITNINKYYERNIKDKVKRIKKLQKNERCIFSKILIQLKKKEENIFSYYEIKIDNIIKKIINIESSLNNISRIIEITKGNNTLLFLAGDLLSIYEIRNNQWELRNQIYIDINNIIERKYNIRINDGEIPIPRSFFIFNEKLYCLFSYYWDYSYKYGDIILLKMDSDGSNIDLIEFNEIGVENGESLLAIGYDNVEKRVWYLSTTMKIIYLNYEKKDNLFSIYSSYNLDWEVLRFMKYPILLNNKEIIFTSGYDGHLINLISYNINNKEKKEILKLGFRDNTAFYDGMYIEGSDLWITSYGSMINDNNKIKYGKEVKSWFGEDSQDIFLVKLDLSSKIN